MDSLVLSEQLTESARKLLQSPGLQIHARPEWGSHDPAHRELIRAEIQKLLPENWHSSTSHTEGLGVIMLSASPIGVDVEVTERVTDKTVSRVSSQEELTEAPSAAALWCAKEACFKALRSYDQPSVISKISIGSWENIDSQTETFRLSNPETFNSSSENRGVMMKISTWSLAFFIFPS
ncbi:4'-phosphopantetheinyl transferase superfamily protein [Bdellovibrio bacteriovorus]|uniref:4'-phosphopantetheinyl transferase superfamily protein n=1 Tax=Bdellovibrio bacteriovorus TaxID=959 RepID=UPI003AA7E08A